MQSTIHQRCTWTSVFAPQSYLNPVKKSFLTHFLILCRFITHKWGKNLKSILVTFQCYFVTYPNNHLTCVEIYHFGSGSVLNIPKVKYFEEEKEK